MRKLGLLTLTAALCGSVAMPAMAQTADEIIVTATKRDTGIQDVPLAVTVVSPAQLETQGVTSIKDLGSVAAGFNIQSSQTETRGTSIRIRGVGTTGNNIGLESAVGVFIDGVYQSRPGIALGELTDIESLELLRGPQGTLFGRNTSAGALNIRTKAPDFDGFSGFADFTYGNFDLINVQAGANYTASDDLAFRVNGAYRQRDGFLTSSIDPDIESANRDRFLIKGQALWQPTDLTSLRIIADYAEADENCCAAVTLSASPNLGPFVGDLFPAVGFEDSLEERIFNDDTEFENGSESFGFSGELVHDFGFAEATLIGSYRDFEATSFQGDFNGSNQYEVTALDDDIRTITAELRFQGEAFDDRLDWLIGGYWADETIDEVFALELGTDFTTSVSQANFGTQTFLGLVSGAGSGLLDAGAGNPPVFAPISSVGAVADNRFSQDATSLSIFTHNIVSLTDRLDLTVGARYNDDTKDGSFEQLSATNPDACVASLTLAGSLGGNPAGTVALLDSFIPDVDPDPNVNPILGAVTGAGVGPGAFINCFPFSAPVLGSIDPNNVAALGAGAGLLPREFDDTFDDSEFIYTIKLDYDVTDDLLVYASFAHGYKAGGFNLDATAAQGGNDPRFNSEEVDTYEIGLKSTLADGRIRLNLTGFFSTFDDFQVLEFTGTNFQTFNVDDVTSEGVEVELNANLSDAVTLNAGLTYADAEYGDDCDDGGAIVNAIPLCGFSLTNAPEFTSVLGITYDGDFGDSGWGLLGNINLATSSDRRTSTNPFLAPSAAAGTGPRDVLAPFDVQDSVTKVNARFGFSMPDDRASIEFWGLNLTDEITRGITFNTPLQGASRSAFIESPRQYGVTVRTNF